MEGLDGPHPYDQLNFDDPIDRRLVAAVYALMAREALDAITTLAK
jgi:hypothetical protein